MHVFICDPSEGFREKLARSLRARGWSVKTFASAMELSDALDNLAQSPSLPHTVAVPIDLGKQDGRSWGIDLVSSVRHRLPDAVILALVPDGNIGLADQAMRAGADAWAFRSMDLREIYERIRGALLWKASPVPSALFDYLQTVRLDEGISIIDRSYCIRYVNTKQLEISADVVTVNGVCWVQYDKDATRCTCCPWCPAIGAFADGKVHKRTTLSVGINARFYEIRAVPIADKETGVVVAVTESIRDITEPMKKDCLAAILEGCEAFQKKMEEMLGRMCDLGFDRARLYVAGSEPCYLDGLTSWGKHHADITEIRLDEYQDTYFGNTRRASSFVKYTEAPDGVARSDPSMRIMRDTDTPWLEGPLRAVPGDSTSEFVGKISIDNETSGEPLERNKRFWHYLDGYAAMIGPILKEEREYRLRTQRAEQVKVLRELDEQLVEADDLHEQMEAIVEATEKLLKPDHCHIRIRKGTTLELYTESGVKGRVRPEVHVENDRHSSVSAAFVVYRQGENHTIWVSVTGAASFFRGGHELR